MSGIFVCFICGCPLSVFLQNNIAKLFRIGTIITSCQITVEIGEIIMKISTKGRYALRMVIDLAEHADDGFISLKDIAARQGLSKKYLEQIVPLLNKTGMLSTTRGYQGGYKLAKSPSECTVGAILQTTEGSLAPVSCLEHTPNPCERCSACDTLPVWEGLNRVIMDYLDGITIQTILDQKHELEEKHRLAAEEILNRVKGPCQS